MLNHSVIDNISTLVRSGFYDEDRLLEIFTEEMYAPGALDVHDVRNAILTAIKSHESDKIHWPNVTDCDRLDAAFLMLLDRGIIALHNAGNTQDDGYSDCMEFYSDLEDKDEVIGYCFYHSQDLERAVRGEGLYLAFGPIDPDTEESHGITVGKHIKESLIAHDLNVAWNNSFNSRIFIPNFQWQKR